MICLHFYFLAYQKHMKCVVDQEDVRLNREENNEIIAEYYQVNNN